MRHLANLPDAVQAENFGDYLTAQGIPNSREESGGKWAIWVEREEQIDQARAELQQFQQQPGADKYQNAARSARAFEAAQEQLTRRLAKNFVNVRLQQSVGERGVQQTYPATIVLVGACVLVALISQLGNDIGRIDGFFFLPFNAVAADPIRANAFQLIYHFGVSKFLDLRWSQMAVIRGGEYWRLITPIFIHFGVMHLVFDMWWLWDLGRMIERRKGTVFFLILVFVSALISNIGNYAWSGPNLAGGMSGVVYGLFGYAWMKGVFQPEQRVGIHQQTVWIMLAWLVLCMTGMLGPIANGAHVFGLIIGLIYGVIPWTFLRLRRHFRTRAFR